MIDTQSIRTKILDLAMRGQLTEQLPEDGTAEELYQQIQAEKQALIKAGKIKKEKPLPEITEGETPFEIPGNWKWVAFGNIITLQSGQDLKPEEYNSDGKGIPYLTGASNFNGVGNLIINRWTEQPKNIALKDDVLLSCKGTVGKLAILNAEKVHIARQFMAIRSYKTNVMFTELFMMSVIEGLKKAQKGLIPGIERNDVLRLIMPLPPIAEQQRIVDRVQQAFSALDTIDELQKQYADNLTVLKSKLIDAAIQGKLTAQLPEDGTAEELYQQIQEEKQALVKAGKIKKEKPLPAIKMNEIPFEIPANWKWVRLSNLARTIVDCPHSTPHYYEQRSDYVAIDTNCIDADGNITQWRYIDKDTYQVRISRLQPMYNDIVYTREGSICRAAIIPDNKAVSLGQRVMLIRCPDGVLPKYLKMFLMSPQTVKILTAMQRGIGALHVNVADVCNLLVPLPPKAEQERVIAKLDKLMPLCRRLK